jgi:gamma-glutamyl hercynylcysteine S-oxide synthase
MTTDLVEVPPGTFRYRAAHRFREGGFLHVDEGPRVLEMASFRIGRFPVTNAEYAAFLDATGHTPAEPRNFLHHLAEGGPGAGPDHPVTWVDLDDARAYCAWSGTRLPTGPEWQWAAQGDDGRPWPWGREFDPSRCNGDGPHTAAVGAHPHGAAPCGAQDLVGNVWEWTDPVLSDGWHRWTLLRGGSHHRAEGSRWYADGGPHPVDHQAKFLLLAPALDRCATVGFRVVLADGPTTTRAG